MASLLIALEKCSDSNTESCPSQPSICRGDKSIRLQSVAETIIRKSDEPSVSGPCFTAVPPLSIRPSVPDLYGLFPSDPKGQEESDRTAEITF